MLCSSEIPTVCSHCNRHEFSFLLTPSWANPRYHNSFFQHLVHTSTAHPREDLWWWLTRPCPGHKLLFGQPYLLWGVKGEPWITWRGAPLSKHSLLSDDSIAHRGHAVLRGLTTATTCPCHFFFYLTNSVNTREKQNVILIIMPMNKKRTKTIIDPKVGTFLFLCYYYRMYDINYKYITCTILIIICYFFPCLLVSTYSDWRKKIF